MLPLRVHKEESMRGCLLLIFIALITFLLLKERLGKEITVEEALLSARNLKARVFNREVVTAEMTKKQREIFEKVEVIVPKVTGIWEVTGFHENPSNFWISARNPGDFYAPKSKMLMYADDNLR